MSNVHGPTFGEYGLPTPRFKKGDTVYVFYPSRVEKCHPCPECGDEKEVRVVFPDGHELKASCPRCCMSYGLDMRLPSLKYVEWGVEVRSLTVGLIRINDHGDHPVSYMCNETGIGSGSIYYQTNVFATHEEAQQAGEEHVAKMNAKNAAEPVRLELDRIAKLQVRDAFIESHRSQMFRSWYHVHNLAGKIQELLKESEHWPKSDIVEKLEEMARFDVDYDVTHHPLAARLIAAEALVEFFRESIVDGVLVHQWPQDRIEKWKRAVTDTTLRGVNDGED